MAASVALTSGLVVKAAPAALGSSRGNAVNGAAVAMPQQVAVVRAGSTVCRAERVEEEALAVSRRTAVTLFAGVAALALRASPAEAAYGEAANFLGPTKKPTGFTAYNGNGFKLDVPSKWNPSKEVEFPGTVVRFEDNFDATNNLAVVVTPAKKSSITDYGSPEDFLNEVSYLLGQQSYNGKTQSEGGFDSNVVSTASLLSSEKATVNGKDYYKLAVLTRTADGDEGGKHQLITGTVSDGKLYILKVQAGDKRWFKGTKKFVEGAESSFQVV